MRRKKVARDFPPDNGGDRTQVWSRNYICQVKDCEYTCRRQVSKRYVPTKGFEHKEPKCPHHGDRMDSQGWKGAMPKKGKRKYRVFPRKISPPWRWLIKNYK